MDKILNIILIVLVIMIVITIVWFFMMKKDSGPIGPIGPITLDPATANAVAAKLAQFIRLGCPSTTAALSGVNDIQSFKAALVSNPDLKNQIGDCLKQEFTSQLPAILSALAQACPPVVLVFLTSGMAINNVDDLVKFIKAKHVELYKALLSCNPVV